MNQRKQSKSLQDIVKQRQQKSFVGREEQINLFRRNLELSLDNDQRRFIFSVFGQGGVGKTTLLGQYRKIAEAAKVVTALTDDEERSVPEAMARLAQHFEKQGHKLDKFDERYKVYRQKKQELESDPEAPQGFSAFLGQAVAKGGLKLAKQVPVAGAAMDFVDADAFASQAGEWTSFVAKKLTNKDEVRLVQEPLEVLTPLFFKEIAEIADNYDIALFFDTYERTDDFLDSWLLDIFDGRYGEIPANILFIIAGRQELDKNHWANYEGLIARFPLEPFTEEEAKQYLARKGITDDQVIKVILNLSGCFPLLLATLAAEVPNDPSKIGDSSGTAVERFLKWVDDPKRREVALNAAIPLCINEDILGQLQGEEGKALFNWLKEMPFVNERHDGWVYHDVVRTQMLRYKRRLSLQGWAELHRKLAEYYDNLRNSLQLDEDKAWLDETWFSHTLDVTYHRLCESSHKYFSVALNEFLVALKNKRKFAQRLAERILQAGDNVDSAEVKRWGEKLVEGLKAYEEKRYEKAVEMFTALVEHYEIEVKWLPVALGWRGLTYRNMGNYEDALKDFNRAIEINPDDKRAIAHRGITYRLMKRNEDALQDLNRAIEIDSDYKLAIAQRGITYGEMKRYEDALKDFDCAIEIDSNDEWAIALRGYTYHLMKRYEDALKDFDRAIEIDPNDAWAIAQQGITYREMKRYENALKDFDRAIELNPEYDWVLTQRAYTYRLMERYDAALEDFNRAIELNPEYDWVLTQRAYTYRLIERYDAALKDFDRAIKIDSNDKLAIALRGDTYREMKRYEDALKDFDRAIEIDPDYEFAIAQRGITYHSIKRYDAALKDFNRAIELNPEYGWVLAQRAYTYHLMERYEDALKDFDRAIEIDPDYEFAIAQRGYTYHLIKRYDAALKDFNRVIELNPEDDWVLAQRAYIYHLMERYEDALKDFDRAIEIDPDYEFVIAQRGITYLEMERYEDALKDFDRAIELNPEDDWVLAQRGYIYCLIERYENALKDFNRVIETDPHYTFALAQRGITYREMERYEDALKDFDRAIEIDSNDAWVLSERGDTYHLMKRYEDALKDFDRAIEIDPDYAWAIALRGITYCQMKRYEDAIKDFNRAIKLDPDYTWALARRGKYHLMLKQYDQALADLNRSVELQEDDWNLYLRALVYKALNQSAKAQTDLANAVEFAKPKYNENPQDWQNTLNLALYYLAADYISTAKHLYKLALSQNASAGYIHMAIRDLDDFLTVFPEHTQAKAMRMLLDCK